MTEEECALMWERWEYVMKRDHHEFMTEYYQTQLDIMNIVELCLTGK